MKIKLLAELVTVVPNPFKDESGKTVDNYKALFLSDGEVFDINFLGKENYEFLKERERKELEYNLVLRKTNYGTFKFALPYKE